MMEWLKYNVAPAAQVSLFMEKTAVKRAHDIRKSGHSGILQEYPRLYDTPGMIGTNIPKYLEELQNQQPYMLVPGTLLEPPQCFSVVERRAIAQTSLIKSS